MQHNAWQLGVYCYGMSSAYNGYMKTVKVFEL